MAENDKPTWDERAPEGQTRTRYYRFRNKLKHKAGGGGDRPHIIPPKVLAEAEAVFVKAAEAYPQEVQSALTSLAALCAEAASAPAEARRPLFRKINVMAHELKGQGGTFGYPLITTFADSLHKFTGANAPLTDAYLEIARAHINAIRAVANGKISGDGGETGRALQQALQAAIKKYGLPT